MARECARVRKAGRRLSRRLHRAMGELRPAMVEGRPAMDGSR